MIVLPVIARELRVSARHAFTYYLRALGVAALVLACLLFGAQQGFGPALGSKLFGSLHFTLFCAIWVLVPLLTADCISRERREGTLGLLFLTRLNAQDIVAAKTAAQALRALTLWLAVLPVLAIPFLMGGVSWIEAVLSAAINFSAICWALAAGLLASAWSKRWLRALLGTGAFSLLFLVTFAMLVGEVMGQGLRRSPGSNLWQTNPDFIWLTGLGIIAGGSAYIRFFSPSTVQLLWGIGLVTALSLLGLMLAIALAGGQTNRAWQERPPSRVQLWWQRIFCTPMFWLSFFRRWMLRKLERNPIGWLEQRTWSGRLVTWGWFAVIISVYSAALEDRSFFRSFDGTQRTIAWLLAGSLAMSAAGSFRRERENGVLELLLVSPLGEGEIISGRLRGLWGQFLPAFGILLGLWAYFTNLFQTTGNEGAILFHATTFLALPFIGLYFSLRCRNFIAAFLWTLATGLLVPLTSVALFQWLAWLYGVNSYGPAELGPSVDAAVVQALLALCCAWALYHRLKQRAFPMVRE